MAQSESPASAGLFFLACNGSYMRMEWRAYRRAWLKRAFSRKLLIAEGVVGLLALVAAPGAYIWTSLTGLAAWAPSIAFGVVLVILMIWGFIRAPYEMHKELSAERDRLESQLDQISRIELKNRLAAAAEEAGTLMNIDRTDYEGVQAQVLEWTQRTRDLIAENFGEGEAKLFMSGQGLTVYSGKADEITTFLKFRILRLNELIQRLDQIPIKTAPPITSTAR